jgi:hypothetical protein
MSVAVAVASSACPYHQPSISRYQTCLFIRGTPPGEATLAVLKGFAAGPGSERLIVRTSTALIALEKAHIEAA